MGITKSRRRENRRSVTPLENVQPILMIPVKLSSDTDSITFQFFAPGFLGPVVPTNQLMATGQPTTMKVYEVPPGAVLDVVGVPEFVNATDVQYNLSGPVPDMWFAVWPTWDPSLRGVNGAWVGPTNLSSEA